MPHVTINTAQVINAKKRTIDDDDDEGESESQVSGNDLRETNVHLSLPGVLGDLRTNKHTQHYFVHQRSYPAMPHRDGAGAFWCGGTGEGGMLFCFGHCLACDYGTGVGIPFDGDARGHIHARTMCRLHYYDDDLAVLGMGLRATVFLLLSRLCMHFVI